MPCVVHATLIRERVFLWLEEPPTPEEFELHLHNEQSFHQHVPWLASDLTPTYPFQPERHEAQRLLRQLLTSVNLVLPPRITAEPLWLPTFSHCPLPSQIADGRSPASHLAPQLQVWNVLGQMLSFQDATLLFINVPQLWRNFQYIQFGFDMAFWATLTQYAATILEQGQFLPTSRQTSPGTVLALWEPLIEKTEHLSFYFYHDLAIGHS